MITPELFPCGSISVQLFGPLLEEEGSPSCACVYMHSLARLCGFICMV